MNAQLQIMLQQAIQAFQSGNFDGAEVSLKRVLQVDSKSLPALHILGLIKASQSKYKEAADYLARAARIHPSDASIHYNLAKALSDSGCDKDAITHHKKAVALAPNNPEAWLSYGKSASNLGRYEDALVWYGNALSLKPDYAEAALNKGATLKELRRYEEAIAFAEQALTLNPDLAEAWLNKGVALKELKHYEEAIVHYEKALSLKSEYIEAWFNKGNALNELERYEEAIVHYEKALSLKPEHAEALSNKGNALNELGRYEEAIVHYDKALALKADIDWVPGNLLHTKTKICNWSGLADALENITRLVRANKKAIVPFSLLALNDDAFMHQQAAQIYSQAKYRLSLAQDSIPKKSRGERVRIAYFSPDFRNHPVSFLTSELFEIHDRDRFEVFAFSLYEAPAGDEMNARLRKGFDKFIEVGKMSDQEIAHLARELGVDIAIDLAGQTKHSRTGIFSYRAAPIQVNWLGYPGTMGVDFIDYIIADKTIIPAEHRQFYSEKVASLPDTYIVDDSKRVASSKAFKREEFGLPEDAFVFCCFNNCYKFNPQVLDSWSRILLATKTSVIWISENNASFRANIVAQFKSRGIDSERIIFAQKVELMADHLARYALADLFLDTHPYNAHTTALDSLKVGVPILTLMGQSFASRVAASILNAIGLPELIAGTQEEYEALATELAMNPKKMTEIKLKLASNLLTTPLFNIHLFAKNLEDAYMKMVERYQADLQPEHID